MVGDDGREWCHGGSEELSCLKAVQQNEFQNNSSELNNVKCLPVSRKGAFGGKSITCLDRMPQSDISLVYQRCSILRLEDTVLYDGHGKFGFTHQMCRG